MLDAIRRGVKFMPLYFFDFMDGEFNGRDKFGTKLPDVEDAAREAVWALANISKDVRKQYQDRVLALNVRGQSGETVLNVTLTLAVTRFPDKQIECNQFRAYGGLARNGWRETLYHITRNYLREMSGLA